MDNGRKDMEKRQIINIVNFIRAIEPRYKSDMVGAVHNEIEYMKKHNLRGTFLIQYDAMLMPEYVDMLKKLDPNQFELGVWHEIVEPQVKTLGLRWRGRWSWDWHAECGFPMGYTKPQREALADELFNKFHSIFGYYPRVLGSWVYDTHTIRYINDKYGLDAICNCKEQYGTDGYTMWGGYYGQGYYPSKNNVFLPAQNKENQIEVPLFRMLGSDPVYQFDIGIDINLDEQTRQSVITLEPCCGAAAIVDDPNVDFSGFVAKPYGGADKDWTQWYMRENFNGECLSFGYAQAGQENPFGWPWIAQGFVPQCELFEKLQNEGKIIVEPLGDTGRWYKKTYKTTPASAITAHSAYDDNSKNTVWYSTKNYRVNLYGEGGNFRIRDIHIYNDKVLDPFEDTVCTKNCATYEALPFVDGCRYTGKGVLAGGFISYVDGTQPEHNEMKFEDLGNGCAKVTYGDFVIELNEKSFKITGDKEFTFENRVGTHGNHLPETVSIDKKTLNLNYGGVDYFIKLGEGNFESERKIVSENNKVEIIFV